MRSEDPYEGLPVDPSMQGMFAETPILPRLPGKTAPRLVRDLTLYDQRIPPAGGRHILTDPPQQFSPHRSSLQQFPVGGCRHRYVTKPRQSALPPLDNRPGSDTVYKLGAICYDCRSHLELEVDFSKSKGNSCPNQQFPLHHFIYEWAKSYGAGLKPAQYNQWKETQTFECSSPNCQATLTVNLKDPVLLPQDVRLLTDGELQKQRTEDAEKTHPEHFKNHVPPLPINALNDLRMHIKNCFAGSEAKRINPGGKRFVRAFGVQGRSFYHLLEFLGFIFEDGENPEEPGFWLCPIFESPVELPLKDGFQIRLDDVDFELQCLMQQRSQREKQALGADFPSIRPTPQDIFRCLGAQGYESISSSRTLDIEAEHPHYAGLGAVGDFSDNLISFSYQRQTECDPENAPYYLSCLEGISQGRKSELLQTLYAVELSEGKINLRDINDAYQYFGLDSEDKSINDDHVIDVFQSRLMDAPLQEPSMRHALSIIGRHRKSSRIILFATRAAIKTYEQALTYLGVDQATGDDFVFTMFTMKKEEKPSDIDSAMAALQIIADHRNSESLKSFLVTGQVDNVEMDIGEAYQILDIQDRTTEDDMIINVFNVRVDDQPSRTDEYRKALRSIAKANNSHKLEEFLRTGFYNSSSSSSKVSNEIPVGLENIGNTCYLNSLLQFYFTITPLRAMVLDFEDYKMEITEETLGQKRVGSRKVKGEEVRRAQKFVDELRRLFQNMISSRTSSVTPDQEVALLTLVGSDKAETVRRQSMRLGAVPGLGKSLGEINGMPVLGPLGPPPPAPALPPPVPEHVETNGNTSQETNGGHPSTTSTTTPVDGDNSSEATLVSHSGNEDFMVIDTDTQEKQQEILDDKENLPPSKEHADAPGHPSLDGVLTDSSPSKLNEQPSSPKKEGSNESESALELPTNSPPNPPPPPPNKPPPVPPRPLSQEKKAEISNQIQIGAQQDVGEVINNVLFQLQCAIKADHFDKNGEQIDKVKELFFGKTRSYILTADNKERSQDEFFSDIKVNVVTGPKDIYSALDGAFDEQEVDVEGATALQYGTISTLPKILSVQVQRAQYNQETKSTYKSVNHLELKETIFMDRYMDTQDPDLLQRRRTCWGWKKELSRLEARKEALTKTQLNADAPSIFDATRSLLMSLQELGDEDDPVEVSPSLLTTLESLAGECRNELANIETRCKDLNSLISSQFTDLRRIPYRLQSAFFHRGSVSFGHYWVYIYDFTRDKWRKYNDGYVDEVTDRKEIFEQAAGTNPATPYFVVYVADDGKDSLVEPVCRNIEEDVEMGEMENLPTEVDEIAGTQYSSGGMDGMGAFHSSNLGQPSQTTVKPDVGWDNSSAF